MKAIGEVYNEDCLIGMDRIPDKSVDMVLCDLPYGTTASDWDVVIPFEPLWIQYKRLLKDCGVAVLFGAEPFSSHLRLSNIEMFKYDWIWDKIKGTGFLNAKKQLMRNHESISVFYKTQCTYNPQKTSGHNFKQSYRRKHLQTDVYGDMNKNYRYESSDRFPRSVQVFSTDTQNSSLHPNQKPVDLLRYLIRTYTNPGELVLDNCIGSGTTAIACIREGRNYIGFEKYERYYKICMTRIENELAQLKLMI